jgi:hypothetical protein
MNRIVSVVGAFIAGFAVATVAGWLEVPEPPPPAPVAAPAAPRRFGSATRDLEQRVRDLEARLTREISERQRTQLALDQANARLAPPAGGHPAEAAPAAAAAPAEQAANEAGLAPAAAAIPAEEPPAPEPTTIDYSKSELERALIAGGMDANRAADLKRRSDNLSMAEMYLRDQATREEWIDTPRYEEELASLKQQQVSIRDELGDDGYDRYLFALGQTNRVRVDDVMTDSPAAEAGLAVGDMILRYGDNRVFAPDELVAQTQQGEPGEMVTLVIIRQSELMTVQVPRGPLGLRINATQSSPQS